jgi:hypothetical protein
VAAARWVRGEERAASSVGGRGGELGGWRRCARCEAEGGKLGWGPGAASSVGGWQRAGWEAGGAGESWFVAGGR